LPCPPTVGNFDLKTHGGICADPQWIYDGDEPIAHLQDALVEEPEQNLRYFNQVLKPVELREIRLAPGGRALVAGLQLYWKMAPSSPANCSPYTCATARVPT